MRRPSPPAENRDTAPQTIPLAIVASAATAHIHESDYRDLSPATVHARTYITEKLLWFAEREKYTAIGRMEVEAFLAHAKNGHTEPGGRWGIPELNKPLSDSSRQNYYVWLKCFFNWSVDQELISFSPMERMRTPKATRHQLSPIPASTVQALLKAARQSSCPERNTAILLFLLDTGVRVSELCGLTLADVKIETGTALVFGKGNKQRAVKFGRDTARALARYLRIEHGRLHDNDPNYVGSRPLWRSERGKDAGAGLSDSGVQCMLEMLARSAKLPKEAKVSPHFWRRTFATSMLNTGCDVLTVQTLLGHSSVSMTLRYARFNDIEITRKHAQHSPVTTITRPDRARAQRQRKRQEIEPD